MDNNIIPIVICILIICFVIGILVLAWYYAPPVLFWLLFIIAAYHFCICAYQLTDEIFFKNKNTSKHEYKKLDKKQSI